MTSFRPAISTTNSPSGLEASSLTVTSRARRRAEGASGEAPRRQLMVVAAEAHGQVTRMAGPHGQVQPGSPSTAYDSTEMRSCSGVMLRAAASWRSLRRLASSLLSSCEAGNGGSAGAWAARGGVALLPGGELGRQGSPPGSGRSPRLCLPLASWRRPSAARRARPADRLSPCGKGTGPSARAVHNATDPRPAHARTCALRCTRRAAWSEAGGRLTCAGRPA
jgi:hypothetical protein